MAPPKLVLYVSPTCPVCEDVKPIVKKLANTHGVRVSTQQVENCMSEGSSDTFCQEIEYVPTLAECNASMTKCKEIPLEKAEARFKKLGKR